MSDDERAVSLSTRSSDSRPPPPCRAAAKRLTACPHCGRHVTLKTLRYSHKCGRSFSEQERVREQQVQAERAVRARLQRQQAEVVQRPAEPVRELSFHEVMAERQRQQQEQWTKLGMQMFPYPYARG